MLTFLCSPKPFVDESSWNQLNALRSWRAIDPEVQIVIFGAPEGSEAAAEEVDAEVVEDFETSPSGAPSFNAMVDYAEKHGRHELVVYANCDILLNTSMLTAMQTVRQKFERFLLVGERLDLAQGAVLDVREADWLKELPGLVAEGELTAHGPTGADYFGFLRGTWDELPPVYMGRAMCDQALLHHCLQKDVPMIDGTLAVVNVHQHHGYQHVKGGREQVFGGEDHRTMAQAHGLHRSLPTVQDANLRIINDNVVQTDPSRKSMLRRTELHMRYRQEINVFADLLRGLQYWRGQKGTAPRLISTNEILEAWLR